MSGSQSALIGGGSLPIGAHIPMPGAPTWYRTNGREYLRAGALLPYSASYAASIADFPGLRVFGNDAKSYTPAAGGGAYTAKYYRIGTNYVCVLGGSSSASYNASLSGSWTGCTTPQNTPAGLVKSSAANGTSHLVVSSSGPNTAPKYTSDGITFNNVGGTFTTFPSNAAVAYGNSIWVAAADLDGTTKIGYIAAANPSGSWTVAASTNLAMVTVRAIAYGGSVFCAVGDSYSATAGKIITFATPGGAWTDRTSGSGIAFQPSEAIYDVKYDGTAFVALTSLGRVITATDPTGAWTDRGFLLDTASVDLVGIASRAGAPYALETDGAGTVVAACAIPSAGVSLNYISTDHGITWSPMQVFFGKTGIVLNTGAPSGCSYTNGQWIFNMTGDVAGLVNPGATLTTPDLIGWQTNSYFGEMVRIK